MRRWDDLAVDPEVIPPGRVNALELGLDASEISAGEPVAATFEDLPQRYVRQVLEPINDHSTSLVSSPECDHKLVHAVNVGTAP
jgi:hypothetical protein